MPLKTKFFICILMTLHQIIETQYSRCGIMVIVDDSVMDQLDHNLWNLEDKLNLFMKELNEIYRSTILAHPPHNKVYLNINHVKYWKDFLPGCSDGNVNMYKLAYPDDSIFSISNFNKICFSLFWTI